MTPLVHIVDVADRDLMSYRLKLTHGSEADVNIDVAECRGRRGVSLRVVVESPPRQEGCRVCGVIAHSHGRRTVRLADAPCMGRSVELVWHKRTWRCGESTCPTGGWTELEGDLARPRALLTTRACWWAIGQLGREHASVAGPARQLGTTWRTVWRSIQPLLEALAEDETRFADVTALGSMSTCGTTCPPSLWMPAAAARTS
jgi:hypothetical protein